MPTRLLVPTDLSPGADAALAYAVRIAETSGADIHLFHVVEALTPGRGPATSSVSMTVAAWAEETRAQALEQMRARAAQYPGVRVMTERPTYGATGDAILEAARRIGADLIVMGTHGRRGLRRLVLGSVAEDVVRHAEVPVLTVRQPEPDGSGHAPPPVLPEGVARVLVPVDLSEDAVPLVRAAARWAARLAPPDTAPVVDVLHAIEPMPYVGLWGDSLVPEFRDAAPRERLRDALARVAEQGGAGGECLLEDGPVADAVAEAADARGADLVVVATHGRKGLGRLLLGSVAGEIVRLSRRPVLTLRLKDLPRETPAQ
ncbi:MAG: universal stress protein [Rubricoccaceae bacterium]